MRACDLERGDLIGFYIGEYFRAFEVIDLQEARTRLEFVHVGDMEPERCGEKFWMSDDSLNRNYDSFIFAPSFVYERLGQTTRLGIMARRGRVSDLNVLELKL